MLGFLISLFAAGAYSTYEQAKIDAGRGRTKAYLEACEKIDNKNLHELEVMKSIAAFHVDKERRTLQARSEESDINRPTWKQMTWFIYNLGSSVRKIDTVGILWRRGGSLHELKKSIRFYLENYTEEYKKYMDGEPPVWEPWEKFEEMLDKETDEWLDAEAHGVELELYRSPIVMK